MQQQLFWVINHVALDILLKTGGFLIQEGLIYFFIFFFTCLEKGIFSKAYVKCLEHGECLCV